MSQTLAEELKTPIGAIRSHLIPLLSWAERARADIDSAVLQAREARIDLDALERDLADPAIDDLGWRKEGHGDASLYFRGESWDRSFARVARKTASELVAWTVRIPGLYSAEGDQRSYEDAMEAADETLLAFLLGGKNEGEGQDEESGHYPQTIHAPAWQDEESDSWRGPSFHASIARAIGTDAGGWHWSIGPIGKPTERSHEPLPSRVHAKAAADDALRGLLAKAPPKFSPVVSPPPDLTGFEIVGQGGTHGAPYVVLSGGEGGHQIACVGDEAVWTVDNVERGRWSGFGDLDALIAFAKSCGATERKRLQWVRMESLLQLIDSGGTVHYRIKARPGFDGSVEWWIWDRARHGGERRIMDDLSAAILSTEETARAAGWSVGPRR